MILSSAAVYAQRFLCQMCFSSQYYMMMTVHVNGIVYFVLGVQMMIRKVCAIILRASLPEAYVNDSAMNTNLTGEGEDHASDN